VLPSIRHKVKERTRKSRIRGRRYKVKERTRKSRIRGRRYKVKERTRKSRIRGRRPDASNSLAASSILVFMSVSSMSSSILLSVSILL
jgi:hypothetical protein